MRFFYFVKEHIPSDKRWICLVEYTNELVFLQKLNTWNESSMDWKYWQVSPIRTYKNVNLDTMRVNSERAIK